MGKHKIWNSKSKRWVNKTGLTGRKIENRNADGSKKTKIQKLFKKQRSAQKKNQHQTTGYTLSKEDIKKLKPMTQTDDGGYRLNASYYYNVICNGKITHCEPQPIRQPDGKHVVKIIRLVNGKGGTHPKWVLPK